MNLTLLTLLLCIAYTSSYSISKVKKRHVQEPLEDDSNAIYGVEDVGKTVKFSFPKQEKPTLREIVYYHFIEQPVPGESLHGNNEVSEESKRSSETDDDLVVTERHFTNGHGYQFLNETDENDSSEGNEKGEKDITKEIVQNDYEFNEPEFDEKEREEIEKEIAAIYTTQEPEESTVKNENKQQSSAIANPVVRITPKSPSRTEETDKEVKEDEKESISSVSDRLYKIKEGGESEDVSTEIVETDYDFIEPEFDEKEREEIEKEIAAIYTTQAPDESTVKLENKQKSSTISRTEGSKKEAKEDKIINDSSVNESLSKIEDNPQDVTEEERLNVLAVNETPSKTLEQEIRNTELSKFNVTNPSEIAEKGNEKEDERQEVSSSETEEVIEKDTPPLIDVRSNLNKDDVVEEKKSARASLFEQAREKYQNKMGKKQQRRKREVNTYMPEAPTLRPLDINSLPEYVRKLISTPAPVMTTAKVLLKGSANFDEEKLQKELAERIEGIMATLKPKLLEDESNEDEGTSAQVEDDGNETEETRDKDENGKKRQARTYGMNMTKGRGVVWNDLLGEPGMYIEVGEPEDENSINENVEPTEIPLELRSSTHYSIESKPIYMNNPTIEENIDKNHKAEDTNDIFVEVKTNKPTDITNHSTEKNLIDYTKISTIETTTAKNEHLETESIKEDPEDKESNIEKPTTEKIDIGTEKPYNADVKDGDNDITTAINIIEESVTESATETTTKLVDDITTNKTEENVSKVVIEQSTKNNENDSKLGDLEKEKEDTVDEKVKRKIIEITKSEILQELFKNDEFWEWLGNWTTKYTELLMKHVKNMVHDEVGRQLKKQTGNFKKQIHNEIEEALKVNEISGIDDKVKSNNNDKQKTPEENSALNKEKINDNIQSANADKQIPANMEKYNNTAEKDTELIIENDKIMIDGKQLLLTQNTNFDNENMLKHKKDKDRDANKHSSPNTSHSDLEIKHETKEKTNDASSMRQINVTAQNIYGNSAGSEKVTNIFIFYPHDEEDINDIKPFGNSNQENVFLIDKRKEEVQSDLVGQKDESTSTTDVPQEITSTEKPKEESKNETKTTTAASQEISITEKSTGEVKEELSSTTGVPQEKTTENPREEIATTTVVPQEISTTEKAIEEIKEEEITITTAVLQEISTTEKPKEENKEKITTTTAIPQEITEKSSEITTTTEPQVTSTTEKSTDDNKQETTEAPIENKADDVTEKPTTEGSDNTISKEVSTEKPSKEIEEKDKDQIKEVLLGETDLKSIEQNFIDNKERTESDNNKDSTTEQKENIASVESKVDDKPAVEQEKDKKEEK